ncbi:hypothetical protein QR680_005478 [Steinernema hermaphroditum]|uniref:BRICHOS domain-containing protein n=1 Tax=Steinernema hermaphroditum TaxID=289476 RepID=A0AA39LVQ7_9BILA|nr:hypothetical protein QR680_005478 [Steinernema hermaphroditum]
MAEVMRLPQLNSEPKGPTAFASRHSQFTGAPPSYRSAAPSVEDDASSALWSEHSTGSSAIGKRRASWTNLVESDQNLKRYEPNVYPKVSGSLSSLPNAQRVCVFPASSSVSSRVSDSGHQAKVNYAPQPFQFGYQPSIAETASVSTSSAPYPLSRLVPYTPSQQSVVSEFVHLPQGSIRKLNEAGAPRSQGSEHPRAKRDRMESLRQFCGKPRNKLLFLFLILLVIAAIVVAIVLSQTLAPSKHFNFSWLAPDSLRLNDQTPNKITMDVDGSQVKVDLIGAMPFKGSYRTVMDFRTNRVAVMDSSLKTGGNYTTCFIMAVDRNNMPDLSALQRAARNSEDRTKQTQGWMESWNFVPQPLSDVKPETFFNPPIKECEKARWIQLNYVGSNQKSSKCTNCFDFCLPEYGIEKDYARDSTAFNIIKRTCFYMFVPEWRNFAPDYAQAQNQGPNGFGTINGTLSQLGQTIQQAGQDLQSKWISLQTVPQNIANASQQLYGTVQHTIAGGFNNFQNQQQTQNPFGFTNGQQQPPQVEELNNFQPQQQNSQPSSVVGPPYSGQVATSNGHYPPSQVFRPSGQQQMTAQPNQPSQLGSQPFEQQNIAQGQQPQRRNPASETPSPFSAQQPPQNQHYGNGDASRMNGVNGHNTAEYQNQARFGGPTNFQPQPLFPQPQPQQNAPSNNPFDGREPSRFHSYPQGAPPHSQWINVG